MPIADTSLDAHQGLPIQIANEHVQNKSLHSNYVIVGGGTAAFSAAKTIKEFDANSTVLLLSNEVNLPYERPPLSKELWFQDDPDLRKRHIIKDWKGHDKPLFHTSEYQYKILNDLNVDNQSQDHINILLGRKVTKVDPESKSVYLDDLSIQYDQLLLATGSQPNLPDLFKDPSLHPHVSTYRTLRDFDKLNSEISKPDIHIGIIGGGFLGSELACALAHNLSIGQVTQIFPEDGNMGLVFPRYLSIWTSTRLEKEGVRIIPGARIVKVTGNESSETRPISLEIEGGQRLLFDHLIVALGVKPNIFDSTIPIDDQLGGIRTDSTLAVSPNIFAAGDVVSYHDDLFGMQRRVEHYDHAIESGILAARNMVRSQRSEPLDCYKHQPMFWSDLGPEISYEAVGFIDNTFCTTTGVWVKEDRKSDSYGRGLVFYMRDNVICGILMFNLPNRVELARSIIQERHHSDNIQSLVTRFNVQQK